MGKGGSTVPLKLSVLQRLWGSLGRERARRRREEETGGYEGACCLEGQEMSVTAGRGARVGCSLVALLKYASY